MKQWLRSASSIDRVSTRNVLSPLLWLIGLLSVAVVSGGLSLPAWVLIWLMCLVTAAVFAGIGAYIYFAYKSPELLRSEDFSLRQSALDICGSSDASGEELSLILNADQVSPQKYLEDRTHV